MPHLLKVFAMNINLKYAYCNLGDGEAAVNNNLAVTPADMERMTLQGRAIASGSLELYATFPKLPLEDGLPLEERRGTDINMAWEATQRARKKVSGISAQLSAAKV